MQKLDGKSVGQKILKKVKEEVKKLKNICPKVTIILIGDNPASISYVNQKRKACEETGIEFSLFHKPKISHKDLIKKIEELNSDNSVHGILVQLPLPKNIYTPEIFKAINPKKDVDGFTAYNLGKMFLSTEFEDLAPCTPKGVIKLLEEYKIEIQGKNVTVIGHSNIVGKPLSIMFLNRNATVTTCHIHTKNLKEHTLKADILAVAVGKPRLITKDFVKKGAIVIDIGFNMKDNKIVGDVDFEGVKSKASYISPVPGGAGPMTVACLMENIVTAAKKLTDTSKKI